MSRIGKQPVVIPQGVSVKLDGASVVAKGPKGELNEILHPYVKAEIKDEFLQRISIDTWDARQALVGMVLPAARRETH